MRTSPANIAALAAATAKAAAVPAETAEAKTCPAGAVVNTSANTSVTAVAAAVNAVFGHQLLSHSLLPYTLCDLLSSFERCCAFCTV